MSLVICPECKSEISQYSESCPSCGFGIKQYMEENNLYDTSKVFLCPVCANYNGGDTFNNPPKPPQVKCSFCGSPLIQTEFDGVEFQMELYKMFKLGYNNDEEEAEFLKRYSCNKFNQDIYNDRRTIIKTKKHEHKQQEAQQTNIPKCPTCGSTNISKIGTSERVASVIGLGLLSKKINKSFKCNNCKYTW